MDLLILDNLLNFVSLLLLLAHTQGTHCLRIIKLEVPSKAILGRAYPLRCIYDLEGHSLESVKWYQNGSEFYRHAPGNRAKKYDQFFAITGAEVKSKEHTNGIIIFLHILSEEASGRYKCEVTTEKDFNTTEMARDLIVSTSGVHSSLLSSNQFGLIVLLIVLRFV